MLKKQNQTVRIIITILILALLALVLVSCSRADDVADVADMAAEPVVLFSIGMHVEPSKDYNNPELYEMHSDRIRAVADIVEAHDGSMTIQVQTPFTEIAVDDGASLLSDLAASGHELGLHFHEDAHLGKDSESLPADAWCAAMKEEVGLIEQAGGVDEVRYWSGGNLYPDLLEAATCAGLDIYGDWKNPDTQETPSELTGVNPWRPSGGVTVIDGSVDVSALADNDSSGSVTYLPEGLFDHEDSAPTSMRADEQAYFDYLEAQLQETLDAADPDKVNVFHFNVHPGEFGGGPGQKASTAAKYAALDRFLSEVVDPLVADGQLQWATYSEVADTYAQWQAGHPGAEPS